MKRKISLALVIVLTICLFAGCGPSTVESNQPANNPAAPANTPANPSAPTQPGNSEAEKVKIMLIAKNLADPFCAWMFTMAQKHLDEDYPDVEYKLIDQRQDAANMDAAFDQALIEGFNSFVFHSVSGSLNTSDLMKRLQAEGLVGAHINNDPSDGISSVSCAPEYAMGSMIGSVAAEMLPEGAKVVILMSTPSNYASEQRRLGYEDALFKARPDVVILDQKNCEAWSKDIAIKTTEDWCQRFPEIDAVISVNDGMALGALEALKSDGRDLSKIQFFGIDGLADGCLSIEKGEMTASVLQDGTDMAYAAVDLAIGIAKGEITEPQKHDVVPIIINQDNVAEMIQMHKDNGLLK